MLVLAVFENFVGLVEGVYVDAHRCESLRGCGNFSFGKRGYTEHLMNST